MGSCSAPAAAHLAAAARSLLSNLKGGEGGVSGNSGADTECRRLKMLAIAYFNTKIKFFGYYLMNYTFKTNRKSDSTQFKRQVKANLTFMCQVL